MAKVLENGVTVSFIIAPNRPNDFSDASNRLKFNRPIGTQIVSLSTIIFAYTVQLTKLIDSRGGSNI